MTAEVEQDWLFREDGKTATDGDFIHVYFDRASRRPVARPDELRKGLAPLV